MSIFQQASRLKLRFDTSKGSLSHEDLWDLPLTSTVGRINLDDIYIGINKTLKDSSTESYVAKTKANDLLQLKFDIVKAIMDIKIAEEKAIKDAREIKEHNQMILAKIADKKKQALDSLSVEELEKQLK